MIFVTVGHQLPFDRLIRLADEWAAKKNRTDLFAQVGKGGYKPKNFQSAELLPSEEFRRRIRESKAVVAHAGVGTILAAFEMDKPLLVLPRLVRHGEVSSDHQIPTAKHYLERGWLLAGFTEEELTAKLDEVENFRPATAIPKTASPELLAHLRKFIFG